MDNREEDHGYDYRRLANEELRRAATEVRLWKEYHLARAQVYATLAVSAQQADDEWYRNN